MAEPVKIVHFAKCVSCGTLTFIDLLDEHGRCEYCKETKKNPHFAQEKKKNHSGR